MSSPDAEFDSTPSVPILIGDLTEGEAALSQMKLIAKWANKRSTLWRTKSRQIIVSGNRKVEIVRIETKHIAENRLITGTKDFYFDITPSNPKNASLPSVIIEGPHGLSVPFEIGWLHFKKSEDLEKHKAGLGVAFSYSAPGTSATLYVYGDGYGYIPRSIDHSATISQFEAAKTDIVTQDSSAEHLSDGYREGAFHMAVFKSPQEVQWLCLGLYANNFLKFRISHVTDPVLSQTAMDSVSSLEQFIISQHTADGLH